MSTTRMVTKSKSGMSEAAGLVSCIYTKIAIFSYKSVQGSRPSWASAFMLQNKNGSSLREEPLFATSAVTIHSDQGAMSARWSEAASPTDRD
jgi:hypothetical protein